MVMSDLVERLRRRTLVHHGGESKYGWNLTEGDSELHVEAATEIEALRTQLAHWKVFGGHAEGERSKEWARRRDLEGALAVQAATSETLRGERGVLVRLLLEADKVVSTIEGDCQEEWDQLADLRRAIAAATIPHRPEEADLLSLRACIGA